MRPVIESPKHPPPALGEIPELADGVPNELGVFDDRVSIALDQMNEIVEFVLHPCDRVFVVQGVAPPYVAATLG